MKPGKLKRSLVNLYEWLYEENRIMNLRIRYRLRIMTSDQTLAYIEKHHCSIARFGDGEIDLLLNSRDLGFQNKNDRIKEELSLVLKNKNPNLLICISRCLNSVDGCDKHAETFWIEWGKNGHHQLAVETIRKYAGRYYRFGDTLITRPYIDWIDGEKRAKRIYPKLRYLWQNRDLLIVEGCQTRLGVGNDLFINANSIKRVLCPAENAFASKQTVKENVLANYNGELILLALGPTATILASEFADLGIQALDVGHIDIEYEWFLRGAKERIPIPGKFTNEAKDGVGRVYSECEDKTYLSQIVARVGC